MGTLWWCHFFVFHLLTPLRSLLHLPAWVRARHSKRAGQLLCKSDQSARMGTTKALGFTKRDPPLRRFHLLKAIERLRYCSIDARLELELAGNHIVCENGRRLFDV